MLKFHSVALCFIVATALGLSSCGQPDEAVSNLQSDQVETPFWPTAKPGDDQLSTSHKLYPYFNAARAKLLPANYFRELISGNADVVVKYGDWPRYQPGWFSGGTIYHPAFNKPLDTWGSTDWSSFYNELFHAWWGNVFMKAAKYQPTRGQLLTAERETHYRQAHRTNPRLAQEEGYSETVATLLIYMYPRYNPNMPNQRGFAPLEDYAYDTGRTVSAVSHGEQPGYDPAAEWTYMNTVEYSTMFQILTDSVPPEAPLN